MSPEGCFGILGSVGLHGGSCVCFPSFLSCLFGLVGFLCVHGW